MNYAEFRKRYQWNAKTDKLGEGGFGKVYRAIDTLRDRSVVLKIADVPTDHKFSLQREVDLNRDLSPHPNIAQFRNCYRLEDAHGDERDYAVMDYFPDGSLTKVMARALSPSDLHDIVTGMLRGLAHLECEKVIHRDFKPGNVLMARDGIGHWQPKIADFGLSRFTSTEMTVSNSSIGITYDYAAPEQFRPGSVNQQADLWAFGVIVYRLCMGKLPFTVPAELTGESQRIELARIINQAHLPADISQIVEPYQTIIRRCLVKEVEQRVKSATDLLAIMKNTPREQPIIEPDYTQTVVQAIPSIQSKIVHRQPASKERLTPIADKSKEKASVSSGQTLYQPAERNKSRPLILALIAMLLFLLGGYYIWEVQKSGQADASGQVVGPVPSTSSSALPAGPGLSAPPDKLETKSVIRQNTTPVNPVVEQREKPDNPVQKQPKKVAVNRPALTSSEVKSTATETVVQPQETRLPVEQKPEPALAVRPVNVEPPSAKPERSETHENRTLRLSGGTEVVVALAEPVEAATAREGQRVPMQVARPITLNGEVVIAQGAEVMGEVTSVTTGGKKDVLEIRVRSLRAAGGQLVEVRSATFRYVGARNEPLIFKAGQQFIVYTSGVHKFSF